MKLGRFRLGLARLFLERSQRKGRKHQPSLAKYQNFMDVSPKNGAKDHFCYDVILADKENSKGITLIDIHGGAYVTATRKNNHGFIEYFLKKGFDTVLLDYPLNDGKRGVDDQFAAIVDEFNHLVQNIEKYGLSKKVFVTGDSAGGHFALLLAEALCDPKLAKTFGLHPGDLQMCGVLANCPVYDFERIGYLMPMTKNAQKRLFGPLYLNPEKTALYSPKANLESLNCPVFLSSCKRDFLLGEYQSFCQDAKNLKKNLTVVFIDEDNPKVGHVHNILDVSDPFAIEVNDAMVAFMERN